MPFVRSRLAGLRLAVLLALAALSLHQLRYLAGHGEGAGKALAQQGHAYLELLLPVVVSLAAALVAYLVLAAAFARPICATSSRATPARSIAFALALIAAFCLQELVEGMLFAGHPSGLDALLANRGWVVLPIAAGLGCLVSFLVDGLQALERRVAGTLALPRSRALVALQGSYSEPDVRRLAALALEFGFARRPPPHSEPGR
jgi:hypothetical protein